MPVLPEPPVLNLKSSLKKPLRWAFVAGLLTALISLFMPNYYKSEARLLPVDASVTGNLGSLAAAAAAFGVGIGGSGGSDANFVDILNSRWLGENLLKSEFRFQVRSWRFGSEKLHQETLYTYLDEKNTDRALKSLDKILNATKDLKSSVITLSAETNSPELSQQIVRRATDLLNQFVIQNSRTRGSEKASFAEARLGDARKEMDQVEAAFRVFLESNRNYQMSADPAVRLRGARLEAELNLRRQLVSTLAMNREQALLDAKNDIPILNVLDPGNLPIEKSKPSRSVIVLLVTFLVGAGRWAWLNREWVRARLLADEVKTLTPVQE
ncbi:hypothetical protein [Geothrix campi]|uniref:hypothetical protein n=1 Tax=Geothrix campi TaxID=2966450 RepID=UPI00214885B1|nr:hypothetical protein [Geothrix sp. SG10]